MPAHKKPEGERRRGKGGRSVLVSANEFKALKAKADARGMSVPDHVVDLNERASVVVTFDVETP